MHVKISEIFNGLECKTTAGFSALPNLIFNSNHCKNTIKDIQL